MSNQMKRQFAEVNSQLASLEVELRTNQKTILETRQDPSLQPILENVKRAMDDATQRRNKYKDQLEKLAENAETCAENKRPTPAK